MSNTTYKPVVAIITPTFNRLRYLGRAIDSVLSQTYPHWRLLIVDDGSTDDSSVLIDTYADERILRFRTHNNQGVFSARNLALDHLPDEADWITELDSDDYFLPEALTTMVEKLEQCPDVKNARFGSRWEAGDPACESVEPGRLVRYEEKLTDRAPRGEWVVMMHRCFRDLGMRFNADLRRTPSVAMNLRIYKQGPCAHFPDAVRVMSKTPGSLSRPERKDKSYYLEQVAVRKVFFDEFGEDLRALDREQYKKRLGLFVQSCERAELPVAEWPDYLKARRQLVASFVPLVRAWVRANSRKKRNAPRLKKAERTIPARVALSAFHQAYDGVLSANIIDRKTAISLDRKFVYSRIPKAANSTVVANLHHRATGIVADHLKEVKKNFFSHLSELTADELKQLNHFFKFTVVRDPIARLRSAYLDKIRSGTFTHVQKHFNLSRDTEPSFDHFLDYLEQGGMRENGHWSRQKDLLYFPIEQYDYIGKVEMLNDALRIILNAIYGSSGTIISANRRQTRNVYFPLSTAQKKRIYTLYQDDFDMFEYSNTE